MSSQIVLGIESAIGGGSVCITKNKRVIGSWVGDRNVSRAEDLLPNIDRLLHENSIGAVDIDRIIVSVGPGSFTGIKVGIATALGFRAALTMTCFGISAMEALSLVCDDEYVTTAVPVGRAVICVQRFLNGRPASKPRLIAENEFLRSEPLDGSRHILHGSLFDPQRFPNAVNTGWNIASHLCAAVDSQFVSTELRPLFVEQKFSNI